MADCSSQRILTGVVAVLSVLTVILLAILIWRETRDVEDIEKTKLTSENLIKSYPRAFRSKREQKIFFKRYMEGIENRTLVKNVTTSLKGPCVFSCLNQTSNFTKETSRRRRQAPGGVFHGCCLSTVGFAFPDRKRNIFGLERILLQLDGAMQYFAEHQCQINFNVTKRTFTQMTNAYWKRNSTGLLSSIIYFSISFSITVLGCTGCTCYRENHLYTAVVLKPEIDSVEDAEFIEDTETDFFFFDGCCKCINN